MTDQEMLTQLAQFFMAGFEEDPGYAAEVLADQGVTDVDAFYDRARALAGLSGGDPA